MFTSLVLTWVPYIQSHNFHQFSHYSNPPGISQLSRGRWKERSTKPPCTWWLSSTSPTSSHSWYWMVQIESNCSFQLRSIKYCPNRFHKNGPSQAQATHDPTVSPHSIDNAMSDACHVVLPIPGWFLNPQACLATRAIYPQTERGNLQSLPSKPMGYIGWDR